jgi:antirestriction protein ArdC
VPSRDFISMPAFDAFKGADHFYNVAFHELTHWAGHKLRLGRDLKNRFGARNYAAEELQSWVLHSCVRNLALMVTSGTRGTLRPGLSF